MCGVTEDDALIWQNYRTQRKTCYRLLNINGGALHTACPVPRRLKNQSTFLKIRKGASLELHLFQETQTFQRWCLYILEPSPRCCANIMEEVQKAVHLHVESAASLGWLTRNSTAILQCMVRSVLWG